MERSVESVHEKLLAGLDLQFVAKRFRDYDLEFWRDLHSHFLHLQKPLTYFVDTASVCQYMDRSPIRNTTGGSTVNGACLRGAFASEVIERERHATALRGYYDFENPERNSRMQLRSSNRLLGKSLTEDARAGERRENFHRTAFRSTSNIGNVLRVKMRIYVGASTFEKFARRKKVSRRA